MKRSTRLVQMDPNFDQYFKAFKLFSVRSEKFDVLINWVDGVFSEAVVDKLEASLGRQELKEFRVLGVGSGSGEMDCAMLEKLLVQFSRIDNRVVEPSINLMVKYKELVQSNTYKLQGVKFDWRQQTLEQYKKAGDLTNFHFISAVHSMYHIDDSLESSLLYLYDRLFSSGVLLVILCSGNSGIGRLRFRFRQGRPINYHLTSADVRRCLDFRDIRYAEFGQPSSLDITDCFDDASEEGGLLLDFILHIQNFRETAPDDLQRSVMEYLASSDCSEKKNGKILLNIDWDAVIIHKP